MKAKSMAPKTWSPTKYPHLYRHITGVYYARLPDGGNRTWRSLRTEVLSVALPELEAKLKDVAHRKETSPDTPLGDRMTGADAIALRKAALRDDASIKDATRHYWNQTLATIVKTWPEFQSAGLRRVTVEQCQRWAGSIKDSLSPTRFNNTLGSLKELFALAVRKGVRRTNPAADLKRKKIRRKELSNRLPSLARFKEFVVAIHDGGGRFSKACADFVELLAYTGVRTGEAKWIRWQHCDFARGEILVVGHPNDATKGGESRRIPMIPAARDLLKRMIGQRDSQHPAHFVSKVHESQKAMDRAFAALGMERFTHHDLRHYFATVCIESGVDIPTVAKWLGHKDGGALAMRVYGHLRNEHSLAAASKVSFAP